MHIAQEDKSNMTLTRKQKTLIVPSYCNKQ